MKLYTLFSMFITVICGVVRRKLTDSATSQISEVRFTERDLQQDLLILYATAVTEGITMTNTAQHAAGGSRSEFAPVVRSSLCCLKSHGQELKFAILGVL